MDKIARLREMIEQAKTICVFTGAGISTPSGIPDFRSENGLYRQGGAGRYTPEEIISHSFFVKHPEMFYEFYKTKMIFPEARPNIAHRYFASLSEQGKDVFVVTQNIDGLHQLAGNREVYELHGSVHRNYCTKCGKFYSLSEIMTQQGVPRCPLDGAIIKPDVVLYEEPLDDKVVMGAIKRISGADLMLVIGTSLAVYPAASYIRYFGGENLVLLNKTKTPYSEYAALEINDDIAAIAAALEAEIPQ